MGWSDSVRETLERRHGYRIDGQLAEGGMSVVLSARSVPDDRPVALKLPRDDATVVSRVHARLRREGDLLAVVVHSGVVRLLNRGEVDGRPFLVLERLNGRSLAAVLTESGPLPARQAAAVVFQTGAALQAAHDAG